MKVLAVIAHQRKRSYCHAIFETAVTELQHNGHEVIRHDLYEENFDPILPDSEILKGSERSPVVRRHCEELTAVDGYVVVHPNWWAQPPAILKGWIDRVFCQGVAYEFAADGQIVGHLAGKTAVVITTSNTPRDVELELFGDPLENLWKTCIFGFCGVENFYRRNFESIVMSTPEERQAWLEETRQIMAEHFPRSR